MSLTDEFLFDFSIHMPRVLVSGKLGILDNVRRILMITGDVVLADCGAVYVSLHGDELQLASLSDKRMVVSGQIDRIEFFGNKEQGGRNRTQITDKKPDEANRIQIAGKEQHGTGQA